VIPAIFNPLFCYLKVVNFIIMKLGPIYLLVFLLTCSKFLFSQEFEYRTVENNAFADGERLKFRVYYHSFLTGKLDAGIATLEVKNSLRRFGGREVYHIVGIGKSNRTFDLFYKVRDRFESFVDKQSIMPHYFVRRTQEGGYVKDDDVFFDHETLTAQSRKKTTTITPYIQDIISASYYARTLDATNLKVGENISINFFLDDSSYVSVIQFMGRENIETEMGTFRCLAFRPMVATGDVFDNPYPMTLWVTDDKNKVPVLAKSEVIVGSVKMELVKYSGLANPMEARIEEE
jgi:hypothetical protein